MTQKEERDRLTRLIRLLKANQLDLDDLLGPDGEHVNAAAARGLLRQRYRLLTEIREIGDYHRRALTLHERRATEGR